MLLLPKPCAELVFPSCLCFPRLLLPLLLNQCIQLWRSLSCNLYLLHTNTATHLSHLLGDPRLSPTEELHQALFANEQEQPLESPETLKSLTYPELNLPRGQRRTCLCLNVCTFPPRTTSLKWDLGTPQAVILQVSSSPVL